MSLSQTEQADYEAQFADLLGDLSTEGGDNANANAAVQNGDINVIATTETHAASKKTVSDGSEGITTVTATNTEMHKEKDGTTTTTTTRTITSNSSGDPETPQMPEGNAEQDAGYTESQNVQRTSSTSFEESLSDYQPPKRYVKAEERKETRGPSVFITQAGAGGDNLCIVCNKRVYQMEQLIADKGIYHKTCFKCGHCKRILSLGNFAAIDGQLYCKPHFIALFKTNKGKYDGMSGVAGKTVTVESRDAEAAAAAESLESTRGRDDDDESKASIHSIKARYEQPAEQSVPEPRVQSTTQSRVEAGYRDKREDEDQEDRPPQDANILREKIGEKEEVPTFSQMRSVRSMFESASVDGPPPSPANQASKRPASSYTSSRWGDPAGTRKQQVSNHAAHYDDERVGDGDHMDDDFPGNDDEYIKNDHHPERDSTSEEELPPSAQTQNLVAKFSHMTHSDDELSPPSRRGIHKITPPRDELQDGIEEARRLADEQERDPSVVRASDSAEREDELPPPAFTRSILAKFKSMEDVSGGGAPPSPQRAESFKQKTTPVVTPNIRVPTDHRPRQPSRASPDSGIVDFDIHPAVNGQYAENRNGDADQSNKRYEEEDEEEETDVLREADKSDEHELPEQGLTRSLLARWRSIEQETGGKPPKIHDPYIPVYKSTTTMKAESSSPHDNFEPALHESEQRGGATEHYNGDSDHYDEEEVDRYEPEEYERPAGVVRESDTNEEDFLPPPACTRNILAKFQTLEAEAEAKKQHNTSIPPAGSKQQEQDRQFKWTVIEAHPLNRPSAYQNDKHQREVIHQEEQPDYYENSHAHHYNEQEVEEEEFAEGGQNHFEEPHRYANEVRDDVVHADDPAEKEDELPPPAFTRSMLAKFKSMEEVNGAPPTPERAAQIQKTAVSSVRVKGVSRSSSVSHHSDDGADEHFDSHHQDSSYEDVHEDDDHQHHHHHQEQQYADQYQGQPEAGEFENDPFHDPNVVRAGDPREEEAELPERGMTQGLLAKFQSLAAH